MRKYLIILILTLLSTSVFSEDNFVEDLFCGDNICSVGENNLNCYVDCRINSVQYTLFSETEKNGIIYIYNNSENNIEINVKNVENETVEINLVTDEILKLFLSDKNITTKYTLKNSESVKIILPLSIDGNSEADSFSNKEFVSNVVLKTSKNEIIDFPLKLRISPTVDTNLIHYELFETEINNFKTLAILVDLKPFLDRYSFDKFEIDLYLEKESESHFIGKYEINKFDLEDTSFILSMYDFNFDLNSSNFEDGVYSLGIVSKVDDLEGKTNLNFSYKRVFWTEDVILYLVVISFILFYGFIFVYSYLKYNYYKLKKSKYIVPDNSKLPKPSESSILIGKVGGTNKPAYLNVDDLLTHALVAGSTGAGKSVTSSVLVEEILEKNIPVVVFDPTAQWTGFLGINRDEGILKHYAEFNLKDSDAKSYKGIIYNVSSPDIELDFKDYMNPGEITIFNLNSLKPGEYDIAVGKIVDTIFQMHWDEDPHLKMFLVFDEVHRLLEKYGGSGGYVALEKAVREFRKWGIGMLMVSQVSADFKEALQGNVLTEVQLNTKSMEDINKVKTKYGDLFAERITRMPIGTGLFQNPHYNDGKPWFVNIRPPFHDPHKLSDELLEKYTQYSNYLKEVSKIVETLKGKGVNVDEITMDLKLTKNKLKEGRFRMVEIYIESINTFLEKNKIKKPDGISGDKKK